MDGAKLFFQGTKNLYSDGEKQKKERKSRKSFINQDLVLIYTGNGLQWWLVSAWGGVGWRWGGCGERTHTHTHTHTHSMSVTPLSSGSLLRVQTDVFQV